MFTKTSKSIKHINDKTPEKLSQDIAFQLYASPAPPATLSTLV